MIVPRFPAACLSVLLACGPCAAQWIRSLSADHPRTPKVFSLAVQDGGLFAAFESGVFRSLDGGASWEQANGGIQSLSMIVALAVQDSILYSVPNGGGVYRSTDGATTWRHIGMAGEFIACLSPRGASLYAGTHRRGAFRTTDGGIKWVPAGLGQRSVYALAWKGPVLFAGTDRGLWRSDDSGGAWIRIGKGLPDTSVHALAMGAGGIILAGTHLGAYRSPDAGETWDRIAIPPAYVGAMAIFGEAAYASLGEKAWRSRDAGRTWEAFSRGLPDQVISAFAVREGILFASVLGEGVWRRPTGDAETVSIRTKPRAARGAWSSAVPLPPVDGRLRPRTR